MQNEQQVAETKFNYKKEFITLVVVYIISYLLSHLIDLAFSDGAVPFVNERHFHFAFMVTMISSRLMKTHLFKLVGKVYAFLINYLVWLAFYALTFVLNSQPYFKFWQVLLFALVGLLVPVVGIYEEKKKQTQEA